jgi:hypothetical protein
MLNYLTMTNYELKTKPKDKYYNEPFNAFDNFR